MSDDRPREIDDVELDMRALLRALGRALPLLVVAMLVIAVGIFVGLSLVTPRYTAETKILIERGESSITQNAGDTEEARALLDAEGVASQVQLISSRDLAEVVVKRLDLGALPEFNRPTTIVRFNAWLAEIGLGKLGLASLASPVSAEEQVLQRFADRLSVYSVDKTRVITIDFSTSDPVLSARVANAVADEYLALEREAKRSTNAGATDWLKAQIAELRVQVREAEAKVEAFRTSSDLFVGGQNNNQSLTQQALTDLNTELVRVQSARAAAEARAETVRRGLSSGAAFDVPEVQDSQLIQRLREQQISLRAQIAQLSATLLPAHPRIRELNAQLADLDVQVRREIERILKGIDGQVATAKASETEIAADLTRAKAAAGKSNEAEVQLRALDREASADRDLLESYLRRYREATSRQQGDYLPADARVISRAAAPLEPSFPRRIPLSAAATVALLLLAIVFIVVRELLSGRALRRVVFDSPPPVRGPPPIDATPTHRLVQAEPTVRTADEDPSLVEKAPAEGREALRAIVDRIADLKAKRVLTVSSASASTSRPLAAVALAQQLSRRGGRVLLVDLHGDDADGKAMSMTTSTSRGLFDLYAGAASFADVILRDLRSRAHVIPRGTAALSLDMVKSERFATILDALDHTYGHIVIDADAEFAQGLANGTGAIVVVVDAAAADPGADSTYQAMSVAQPDTMILIADGVPDSGLSSGPETVAA